ncbi:MAG: hypothetical protein DDT19_01364 [Syntrophomonadaceae bacterium]|nr:hypothetical protein [Bacillota bacterium]
MNVALITPTKFLSKYSTKSKCQMVLVHIYEQDAAYREFYKERVSEGDFVILDNSAYELGEATAVSRLVHCIEDLHPTAVFLPDVRFDKGATIRRTEEAYKYLRGYGCKLFAVPQGKDLASVMSCYTTLRQYPWIDGFGISKATGKTTGFGTRTSFLQFMEDNGYVDDQKYYHMLGMEEDLTQLKRTGQFKWASSIDSCKPLVYGLYNILLGPDGTKEAYPSRPKGYFDIVETNYHSAIEQNIGQVIFWAKGK